MVKRISAVAGGTPPNNSYRPPGSLHFERS